MNDNYRTIDFDEILFAESFHVILLNLDLIIKTPEYYNCRPKFIGFRQKFGSPHLCLGNLIQLWDDYEFIRKCNYCDHNIFVFYSEGIYQETNLWKGICPKCRQIKSGNVSMLEHYHSSLISTQQKYEHNRLFKDFGKKGLELNELLQKLNLSKYLNMN